MPREAEPSANEKQFLLQALQEGLRLDGRAFDEYRKLDLTLGDEYGTADVSLGQTRVLVNISAEVTVPFPDRQFDGIFQISTELSPMASPHFEPNRTTETEILLSRLLEKTIRRSGALDTESLCLVAGSKVWSVRADVHVLAHDGNLVDAACLATVAALRHFRKPDTAIESGELTIFTPAEREPVPLGWLHSPYCVTFGFFGDEGETVLLDPDWREEHLAVGSCTFGLNKHGEVCHVTKLGGEPVEATTLLKCAAIAGQKIKELSDLVDAKLAEDGRRRDKGGLISELLSAENERVPDA
ncbi:exoribonuclease family protein [Sodiomyces alkalinus F11]|uniref:Exosome complex component RRP45 n=1 Tax=Sodiomyces alkalinus (strain CBS 110278 / VKM F-3762 / F11) TaxID=1314773 RepID=A0A3N2PN45_SODAK|nr:exoribonuclease family protein [Sodiomyces alkalinus F11]ROT35844.1 exoribonuclease family protein [Sodiomyces alkalinus F11]